MAEEGDVGFEEGKSWLPSQVLHEACHAKEKYLRHQRHHQHYHRLKLPAEPPPPHSKSGLKSHQRPRFTTKWASGGPGMQAVFLDSGQRSCGTGVFLPRRADMDFQPSQKPACSPVLLPSRVVHALNLNVHALDMHGNPQQDIKNNPKGEDRNLFSKKSNKDVSTQCCVISPDQSSSPEIFLPKEWTY